MSVSEFFKKLFSRVLTLNCLGIIVLSIVLCIGSLVFLNFYTHHGVEITVPDVRGVAYDVAQKKLKALGLVMEVTDTGYVYNAAPYSVLEQSIKPGEQVKPGRIIYLTINASGPRLLTMPDLADNCSRREAEDKLQILGFKLGAPEYIMGDPDWVYGVKINGKNVPAGAKVSSGTPITLVIGVGGEDDEYNGNDSLDYIINTPEEETEEIIEGTKEEPSKQTENYYD